MKHLFALILLQFFILNNFTLLAQWEHTSGAIDTNVTHLAVLNQYLLAATTTGYNNSQIIASTDNGLSWYTAKTGLARVVTAFAASGSNLFLALDDAGVYISTDNGFNWSQTNNTVEPYAYSFVTLNSKLYVGTYYMGVYVTSDNGNSWTQLDSGLTNLNVNVLAVKDQYLFAGTSGGGVFLSTDYGTSWKPVNAGIPAYYGYMHGMTSIGENLFAGTYNKGVFLSTNNGANWTAVCSGLPKEGASYYTITTLVASGNNLFAANGGGVYLTTNNGTNWTNVSQGLTHLAIRTLVVKDGYLFAAGDSTGVYRRPLSEMTAINDKSDYLPKEFSLEQNYPNPFNPGTTIQYALPKPAHVTLTIYNSLGQEAAKLLSKDLSAGVYTTEWNASGFACGVYYYRISAGDFVQTKKLVLLK